MDNLARLFSTVQWEINCYGIYIIEAIVQYKVLNNTYNPYNPYIENIVYDCYNNFSLESKYTSI